MEPVYDFDGSTPRSAGRTDPSPRPLLSARNKKPAADMRDEWLRGDHVALPQDSRNRKVKCFSDLSDTAAPENEEAFAKEFSNIAERIAAFAATLNGKEQDLHQRQAQTSKIELMHTNWASELVRQKNAITAEVENARCRYKEIAPVTNNKVVAKLCRSVLDIDLGMPPLETINKELTLLLAAEEHQTALTFYKEEKKACESVVQAASIDERVRIIEVVVERCEAKLKSELPKLEGASIIVKEETNLLYLELLDFTLNTLKQLETAPLPHEGSFYNSLQWWTSFIITPDDKLPTITEPLSQRMQGLEKQLNALIQQVVPEGLKEMKEQELSQEVRFHLGQALKNPLDTEDRFRRHPIIAETVYKEIKEERKALENIAQGLAMLIRELIEKRNSVATSGQAVDVQPYQKLLAGLRTAIDNQFIRLRNHTLRSNRLHAGWYYVARLKRKAHDVELYLTQLTDLSKREFTPYATTLGNLFAFLDPQEQELQNNPNYEGSLIATERLWSCLDSASQLKRPKAADSTSRKLRVRLYDTIEQVLCRVGLRTLELTKAEDEMADRILAHEPLIGFIKQGEQELGILPEACLNLLIKGFVRATYYSARPDPKLDVVLHTLKTAPIYKKSFEATAAKSKTFKVHLDNYCARKDIAQYESELNQIAKIFYILMANPFAVGIERFVRYFEARVSLTELESNQKETPTLHHQFRLAWVKEATEPLFTEIEQLISPKCNEHPLTQDLLTALYGKESQAANERLIAQLSLLDLPALPTDKTLLLLLQQWALARLMEMPDKFPPHVHFFLYSLFDNYFKDENCKASCRNLHGVAFMERALYRAQKCFTEIKNMRDQFHKETYDAVISKYDAFCDVFDKMTELPDEQAGNILKQMVSSFSLQLPVENHPPEAETNIGVARWCVIDATLRYAEKLHTRFLELHQKQPNGYFIENSEDHKAACSLRDAFDMLFTEGLPAIATTSPSDKTVDRIRSYRHNLGMVFTLHTTPMRPQAPRKLSSSAPGDQDP